MSYYEQHIASVPDLKSIWLAGLTDEVSEDLFNKDCMDICKKISELPDIVPLDVSTILLGGVAILHQRQTHSLYEEHETYQDELIENMKVDKVIPNTHQALDCTATRPKSYNDDLVIHFCKVSLVTKCHFSVVDKEEATSQLVDDGNTGVSSPDNRIPTEDELIENMKIDKVIPNTHQALDCTATGPKSYNDDLSLVTEGHFSVVDKEEATSQGVDDGNTGRSSPDNRIPTENDPQRVIQKQTDTEGATSQTVDDGNTGRSSLDNRIPAEINPNPVKLRTQRAPRQSNPRGLGKNQITIQDADVNDPQRVIQKQTDKEGPTSQTVDDGNTGRSSPDNRILAESLVKEGHLSVVDEMEATLQRVDDGNTGRSSPDNRIFSEPQISPKSVKLRTQRAPRPVVCHLV